MNKRESVMKKGRGKWIKLTDLEVKAVNAEFEKGTKERFAAIVEFSNDAIFSKTLEGTITSWNRAAERIYGYTAQEIIGKSIAALLPPERFNEVENMLDQLRRGESIEHFEIGCKRKNGALIDVSLTISPIKNSNQESVGASVIARDITERKRAELELRKMNEELKKLDQLKSDFVSTVSHELRTPMTIIREGVSQILDGLLGETTEDQKQFLTITLNGIDRLSRIINDLLDISKLEAGKIELERQPVNLVALAQEAMQIFNSKVKEKGLELQLANQSQEIEAHVDHDKLIQVLTNLIDNAIKFTEQGHIEIGVTEQNGTIVCNVSDTGQGIPEQDLGRVFGKFQQFGRTAGPGEKGTGLGLAIVKHIMQRHGGNISIESVVGHGATFVCTFPAAPNAK